MVSIYRYTLVASLLVSVLIADCGILFASQKIRPIMNDADLGRDLSTNEELLMEFQKQKQALLRRKSKDNSPHLLKNKLKILDGKISFLRDQMSRSKSTPIEIRTIQPIVSKKTVPVVKAKPMPRPVAIVPQPYAKSAQLPLPVQPKFEAKIERPVAQPIVIKTISSAQPAERQQPMARPVPKRVELPVAVKIQLPPVSSEKSSPPAVPASPGKKTAKIGTDWKKMTAAEKDIYTLSIMGNLSRRDVFLERGHSFYIHAIDSKLQNEPSLENEFVHRILINSAYENEPESRQDLDRVRK